MNVMPSAREPISFCMFLRWVLAGIVVAFFFLLIYWMVVLVDGPSELKIEKEYAREFYSLLQGQGQRYYFGDETDLVFFTRYLRSLRKNPESPFILEVAFRYATLFAKKDYDWQLHQNKARAQLGLEGIDFNLFANMLPYIEDKRFAKLAKHEIHRERIRALVFGREIASFEIDTSIPSKKFPIILGILVSQFVIGLSYFIFYLGDHTDGERWWYLPWSSIWPFFTVLLWFPGALPLVIFSALIEGIVILASRRAARRAERFSSEHESTSSKFDDEKLLSQLEERLRLRGTPQ